MLIRAGADTTGTILQGFFKIMALHQDAVREAQEGEEKERISLVLFKLSNSSSASDCSTLTTDKTELDRVVGPNRMPTWDDEKSLPGIRSLIKEMHRYAPIGSLGNVHYQPLHARILTLNHSHNPLQRELPRILL